MDILQELAIFNKFDFEKQPVGVKFVSAKPKNIGQLDKTLDFCEMLIEAQKGNSFYAAKENFTCVGPMLLGMVEHEPVFESGQVGPKLGVFKEGRANLRIYQTIPRLAKNTVKYVIFSPLSKLSFDPDVFIVTAKPSQAEIILRATSFSTGKMWSSRGTPVLGCAWLYIYPYVSGELNFTITGFGFGMRSRRLFPEGLVLMSIPYDLLPGLINNLKEMEWEPESYKIGGEEHKKKIKKISSEIKEELGIE
jgi:uncharacterized protein (DUF169 family)